MANQHSRGSGAAGLTLTSNTWETVFDYAGTPGDEGGAVNSFGVRVRSDSTATEVLVYVEGLHGLGAPGADDETVGVRLTADDGWGIPFTLGVAQNVSAVGKVWVRALDGAGKVDVAVYDDLDKIGSVG